MVSVMSPPRARVPWHHHPAFVVPVALIAMAALLLFGTYHARIFLTGSPSTVCIVTPESLADDASLPPEAGTSYSGDDHPKDPDVGDEYFATSGCLACETNCVRTVELLGSRLDC